jgi:hypothetical protein
MLRENPRFKDVPKKFLNGMALPHLRFITGTRKRQALVLLNAYFIGRRLLMSDPSLFATHTTLFATEGHSNVSDINRQRPLIDFALKFFDCHDPSAATVGVGTTLEITD